MSSMAERILIGNTMPTGRRPVDKLCQRERERRHQVRETTMGERTRRITMGPR